MPNKTRGVGLFTAENIVAVMRAIPESDGMYSSPVRPSNTAATSNTTPSPTGSATAELMLQPAQPSTAYARFTKLYRDLIAEHCQPDNNRNRELDQALEILERTCECGNDKMLLPDGKLGNTCQECQDLDALQRRQRTA